MAKSKYIVITGGVLSGLGKGAITASLGRLLRDDNKLVTIKCDGYFNVDPGTMNPYEHGEVFVLDDGAEVDMDFGHYERMIDITAKKDWNLTSGKVFYDIISKERRGDFLGKTVQMFPHVINYITDKFQSIAEKEDADITLIEIGGTTDDDENKWFIRAVKELQYKVGKENFIHGHLTYIPYVKCVNEIKTRIAQGDLAQIGSLRLFPDILFCRSDDPLEKRIKDKISHMGQLREDRVISTHDVDNIYEIPLILEKEGVLNIISKKFGTSPRVNLKKWRNLVDRIKNPYKNVKIAICGKYTELHDAYASIIEAVRHAGAHLDARVELKWVETTEKDEDNIENLLSDVGGIIIPGGFGSRGTEGKINVIKYARENNIPFLGLCLGLQLAVVEYARNVCGLEGANSTEIDENTQYPVVDILKEQKQLTTKGGNMRLGAYEAEIEPKSLVQKLYKQDTVSERHRHRYEVNPNYHDILKERGLVFSGMSPDRKLVEFIELPKHRYFVATQAHPEFKSRLEKPAPLFYGLVKAALNHNL